MLKSKLVEKHRPAAHPSLIGGFCFAILIIATNVVVRGATGDFNDVILDAQRKCRAVTLAHTNAVLADLTVKRGWGASCGSTMSAWGNAGGCVRNEGGEVRHCRLTEGSGSRQCAGVGIANLDGRVIGCTIDNNTAGGNIYGGLGMLQTGDAAVTDRTIVTNNLYSYFHTGALPYTCSGILMLGGTVRNSLIAGNSPGGKTESGSNGAASGVLLTGGTLKNCAVIRNRIYAGTQAPTDLGPVVRRGGTIINCLIRDNIDPSGQINDIFTANPLAREASYCCLTATNGIFGAGNIAPASAGYIYNPLQNHAFRLTLDSPARDAALARGWMTGTADLNGNPRLGGLWPDIGPVEIEARTLDCVFTCDDATDGESPLSVTFKPAMAGAPAGNCDYYWHFHNRISGAVTTIGPLAVLDTPTYTRLFETGVYDVTLEARDRASGNSRSYLVPDLVCARPLVSYVDPASTAPAFPYDTWETACSTFDAAVASARSGATVLVADGDYRLSVQCPVSLPITIKSVNGPYRTVISGNRGFQLIRLDHAGAVLGGFLMTNGLRAVYNSGATVRNCRFTGNTIGRNVAALSLYNDNGRVENCEFFEARRGLSYAHQSDITYGSLYQKGADAVTERCTFRDNYFGNVHQTDYHLVGVGMHMVGGTVRTSLFVANGISNGREGAGSANRSAAGLFMTAGTAANCTFVGNYSLIPPESETGVATNTLGVHAVAGLSAKGITTPGAVKNCLFIGNTNDFGAAGAELFAADGVAVNCRVDVLTPALAAQGCINADPLFRDYAARDFRLRAASPCARSGRADEAWMQGALDLGGEPIMYRDRMPVGCFAAKDAATMLIVR